MGLPGSLNPLPARVISLLEGSSTFQSVPKIHRDVDAVARKGEAPVAKNFGVSSPAGTAGRAWPTARKGQAGRHIVGVAELREAKKRTRLPEQGAEVNRRALAYLVPGHQRKSMYLLVRDLAADKISVTVTCRVLGVSTKAFYMWRKRP